MKLDNCREPSIDDVFDAAGEMTEAICRLRGVSVESLSSAELREIMDLALSEAYGAARMP
jgi:hypothetical protein